MIPEFKTFFLRLSILSIVVAVFGSVIFFLLPPNYRTRAFFLLIVFFYIINLLVYYILAKASLKKFSRFVNYFLAGSFLKLLVYIIVLVAYVMTRPVDVIPFVITYFGLYLVFTIFEVVSLVKQDGSKHGS